MGAEPLTAIVYQARNLVNGHRYIGFTTQGLDVRAKQHRYDARKGKNFYFHRAIAKHGEENFIFGVLHDFGEDYELGRLYEREAIERYQPEYNLMLGGDSHLPSLETRAKLSRAHKGKKWPDRAPPSAETKAKISASMKGKSSVWLTGRTRTAEERAKISAAQIGRVSPTKGKPVSEETRQKLREKFKGRPPVNKGGHHTAETIQRMSAAIKKSYENPSPKRLAAQKATGKARSNALRKAIECTTDGNKFDSIADAARFYGVSKSYLGNVVKGRFPPMRGLVFRYIEASK